jgi:hypothetical protein
MCRAHCLASARSPRSASDHKSERIDDCVGGSQSTISSLGTGEAPENDAYGIVPRELRKTSMVERKMEAMGSKAAKIRVAEPLSDRLASLLRPIVRCV